ncbi:RidA family protein [Allosalinactinospora lopnorensis]|uniref:RidA family protein n=1 Tax=Allosalinactinospora lopnorensis TaxID=1352348 RepID=UPI000623C375|nr:Rid family hydrolase [Allosalinactinospora lopnorensis]
MPKRVIHAPDAAPPGGPYSHAVVAGDHIHCAGAIPARPDGSRVEGPFVEQARAAFDNLAAVAGAAGATLADAVRVGVYLRDLDDFAAMNELFAQYFGAEPPARTTLRADLPGFAIEVDAVLYRPSA